MLGTAPLTTAGTAVLSLSSLGVGTTGIQAIFQGIANALSSVSAVLKQTVGPAPTLTSLTVTTQPLANGRTKLILVAGVTADGSPTLTPTGTVVFRKNGKSLGTARLRAGVATLIVRTKLTSNVTNFVASFQKNARFRSSASRPVQTPG